MSFEKRCLSESMQNLESGGVSLPSGVAPLLRVLKMSNGGDLSLQHALGRITVTSTISPSGGSFTLPLPPRNRVNF